MLAQTEYQSRRADLDHEAWRQRTFFNSTSKASETPAFTSPKSQYQERSDGIDWEEAKREAKRRKAEEEAWDAKLNREAKERRAQAYQEIRRNADGRMPLTEPPQFASGSARTDWYVQEADRNPEDPFVAWSAAEIAVSRLRSGLTSADARRWLAHADPSWPETKALLGRLLILGEGGPADIARGWELLRSAEPALRGLSLHERARGHLYYAMGRAYAEGLGGPVDDVAALWAFDHNVQGSVFLYPTWEYVVSTFWPARALHAAAIVEKAEATDLEWSDEPRVWLRSATRRTPAPDATPQEKAVLNELKRQHFACTLADQDRVGPGNFSARYQVASLVEDGVPGAPAEYLMPDRFGQFFIPTDETERARWEREGLTTLEELASRGDGRAAAGMTARLLAPSSSPIDLSRAEQWAEKSLTAGNPWGAVYVALHYVQAALSNPGDAGKAQSWFERAEKTEQAARYSAGVYWFIRKHCSGGTPWRRQEKQWLQLGVDAGNVEAIILSSNDALRDLTYDHERAGADEAVWSRAERLILDGLIKANNRKSRTALRAQLGWLQGRHTESLQQDQEVAEHARKRDAELDALVAAETPRLPDRLAAALQLLHTRVADTSFRGRWEYSALNIARESHPASDWAHRLSARNDAAGELLSAAYYVEAALDGAMLLLFHAEDQVERAAPDSLLLKQWRTEIANALEVLVERGDSSAALWLAEKGGPDGGHGWSVEADWHAARWYRRAAELGDGEALFKLQQHFEDKEPVAQLYAPLRAFLSETGEKDEAVSTDKIAGLATLPSPTAEYAAIQEYWRLRAERRDRSLAAVTRELPDALSKIEKAVQQFEAVAASPGKPGQPFFHWSASADYSDEDNALEEDAPSLETELVLTARYIDDAAAGTYYFARSLPGEWFDAQPELGRRWNAALERILIRDAELGDVESMNALCGLYSPEKNAMTDGVRWVKNADRCLDWCRRAIAAGEFAQINTVVVLYSEAATGRDSALHQAWLDFRDEARPLAEATRAERMAFAAQHMPPAPSARPKTKI